ncbi:MAG: hypothetical protein JJT76_08270 [Clostridiaceae bacterium]|nr:hypothetical protein [Clostridiaceae bacterium]
MRRVSLKALYCLQKAFRWTSQLSSTSSIFVSSNGNMKLISRYMAWISIKKTLNHSSITIAKRYLGITQDEINEAYMGLNL